MRNDAKVFRFCRSKCHKHFKAKHNPRKMKWTKAYRKAAGKEMVVDSTFAFEKRRNCPVRYDRDLVVKTVQAMKKIDSIKEARKERFYKERMLKAHLKQLDPAKREIEKHSVLLHGPHIPETQERSQAMEDVFATLPAQQSVAEKLREHEKQQATVTQDVEMMDVEQRVPLRRVRKLKATAH